MKLMRLDINRNIKLEEKISTFLAPDYIYMPISKPKIPLKRNQKIKKGEQLFSKSYSSVSGKIVDICNCSTNAKEKIKCLKIANDFKESLNNHKAARKSIKKITKEELLQDLVDVDVKKLENARDIRRIIISGIDNEPFIENEKVIQKENTKNILEIINLLLNIFPDSRASITIKTTDIENIEAYTNFLGTYENIELCLVEDLYLIGEEEFLIQKLHCKDNYLYFKTSELLQIYRNVVLRKQEYEKYLTITGDGIEESKVFIVKIGTKVIDIINQNYKIDLSKYDIYVNGLMKGKKQDIKDLIVTKDLNGVLIMKQKNIVEKGCINCGKCLEVCPIKSNPLIALKRNEKVRCIGCGLCSYICPSYINLRKYLNGDIDE